MLQERNQGGAEGDHLARGDVHVVHGAHRHIDRLFFADSGKGGLLHEVAVLVELLVGLGNDVVKIAVSVMYSTSSVTWPLRPCGTGSR